MSRHLTLLDGAFARSDRRNPCESTLSHDFHDAGILQNFRSGVEHMCVDVIPVDSVFAHNFSRYCPDSNDLKFGSEQNDHENIEAAGVQIAQGSKLPTRMRACDTLCLDLIPDAV